MIQLKKSLLPRLTREDQSVSFAELFFDIVFVFSVTQVVHLLHGHLDWKHFGQAVLVFWLVWWAWTQYTWALNAADTRHGTVLAGILVATACVFFMAVSLPGSFSTASFWFAMAYVAVRCIGLSLYILAAWSDPKMRHAVMLFGTLSIAGMVAVLIGGLVGGAVQYILWGLAILLDIIAASLGGRRDGWNLHPMHFSERHGLFVIIALGETLIIAASGAVTEACHSDQITVSMLAMGVTSAMWWLYFFRMKNRLEHSLASNQGQHQSEIARDAYSLFHFPLLCGLIIYAYAIESAMHDAQSPLSSEARMALALGIVLFAASSVVAYARATGTWMWLRLLGSILVGGLVWSLNEIPPAGSLAIVLAGLALLCWLEELFQWKHPSHPV